MEVEISTARMSLVAREGLHVNFAFILFRVERKRFQKSPIWLVLFGLGVEIHNK